MQENHAIAISRQEKIDSWLMWVHLDSNIAKSDFRFFVTGIFGNEHELKLIKNLLSSYDIDVRPSAQIDQPVNSSIELSLLQLLDLVSHKMHSA